ncbi:MAG: sigma-70 family RNA polymerase sigma factor [Pseudomonadota bacterium]
MNDIQLSGTLLNCTMATWTGSGNDNQSQHPIEGASYLPLALHRSHTDLAGARRTGVLKRSEDASSSPSESCDGGSVTVGTNEVQKASQVSGLYQDIFRSIVGILTSTYGEGPPDPEDVVQRAFANLSAREDIEQIDDLKNYMWIAARNLMLTEIRALKVRSKYAQTVKRESFFEECDEIDAERVFMAREEMEIVTEVIASMPERRRNIFLAKRVDGLSAEAAGQKYGVSRSSAVRHIAIATEQLTKALAKGSTKVRDRE